MYGEEKTVEIFGKIYVANKISNSKWFNLNNKTTVLSLSLCIQFQTKAIWGVSKWRNVIDSSGKAEMTQTSTERRAICHWSILSLESIIVHVWPQIAVGRKKCLDSHQRRYRLFSVFPTNTYHTLKPHIHKRGITINRYEQKREHQRNCVFRFYLGFISPFGFSSIASFSKQYSHQFIYHIIFPCPGKKFIISSSERNLNTKLRDGREIPIWNSAPKNNSESNMHFRQRGFHINAISHASVARAKWQ